MSNQTHPPSFPATPQHAPTRPRRFVLGLLLGSAAVVALVVVAIIGFILWPNPTVPAAQPNMTPVMAGTNNDWLSFDDFVPGTAIATDSTVDASESVECTLSFLGRGATGAPIAFTAGHCDREGYTDRPYFTRKADPDTHIELGEFSVFQTAADRNKVVKTAKDDWSDFAVIGLDPRLAESVDDHALIAGVYRVTKVLDFHYLLNTNVTLCKFGFVSGETCGTVQKVTESRIEAELFSSSGDSGAPAYVKLGNDEVAAVGILRGSPEDDDGYTEFALIAPILDSTGATLTGDRPQTND